MTTTTLRQTHTVTANYSDLIASIPAAANANGFVKHLGGADVEMIFGGTAPDATMRGTPLASGGEEWAGAAHIWVRCRVGLTATLGFNVVE